MRTLHLLTLCFLALSASCLLTLFEEDIRKLGYPLEIHSVKTPDDFVLTLFRIQKKGSVIRAGLRPVLLCHGLDEVAHVWVMNGEQNSLGLVLADQDYDVWLLNSRGTAYSRYHLKYGVDDPELWDFSFQEMAQFDVPTVLDYISQKVGGQKLAVLGHSQGATQFIAAMSDPETSARVQRHMIGLVGLSPVTHISDVPVKTQRIYQAISYYVSAHSLLDIHYPFLSSKTRTLYKKTIGFVCNYFQVFCEGILSVPGLSVDYNRGDLVPKVFEVLPGGASFRCYLHFVQLSQIDSEQPVLRRYDFGEEKNLQRYGSVAPPDYDFSLINTPFTIHSGREDILVTSESLARFGQYFRSIGKDVETTFYDKWDHFSVILSKDPSEFQSKVLGDLERFWRR